MHTGKIAALGDQGFVTADCSPFSLHASFVAAPMLSKASYTKAGGEGGGDVCNWMIDGPENPGHC